MLLGRKIRELRENKRLVQREIAALLQVDTAFISKVEHGERKLNRIQLSKIAEIFEVEERMLLILWLSDKSLEPLREEPLGKHALKVALEYLKNN